MGEDTFATLSFVGDVAFFSDSNFEEEFDFEKNYSDLLNSDFRVANFEFPFTIEKKAIDYTINFNHIPNLEFATKYLQKFKFDLLVLANNHITDWGVEGIETTINVLNSLRIKTIGAGKNKEEAGKPLIQEINGIKFGFLSYAKYFKSNFKENEGTQNALIEERIINDVKKIRTIVDHVIINLHLGTEFVEFPQKKDIDLAHKLIEIGASLIIGHHQHVLQGYEAYKNKLIFYGLGSFVYSPLSERIKSKILLDKRCLSIAVLVKFTRQQVKLEKIVAFRNNLKTPFPVKIEFDEIKNYFDNLSEKIKSGESDKLYYKSIRKNLFLRELLTIIYFIKISKGKYLFKLFKFINLKNLKIMIEILRANSYEKRT